MGVFPSVYFLRSSVSQALFGQISLKKGHGLFEKKKKNSLGVMSYLSIMVLKEWESVKVSMQIYTPRNPGILEQCQGLGMWLFFEKNRSIYYILNTVLWQGFHICSIEALEKFIWIIQFIMCPQTFVTLTLWQYNNTFGSFIFIFWILRHS